jgi:anti-sigma factor RsiW
MNCRAVEKILTSYLDGRADADQRREMKAHLAECRCCLDRARQLGELWGLLEELPVLRPSPGFDAAVRARIAQEPIHAGLWGWLLIPSPRLVIGVAALLIVSIWLSSLPRVQRPSFPPLTGIEAEFRMIEDLPILEDYDVLLNFEALSELPVQPAMQQPSGI